MALITGLAKFGFGAQEFDVDGGDVPVNDESVAEEEHVPEERDYIYSKEQHCPLCNTNFATLRLITSKERKLDPDYDLRPRNRYVDPLKYQVTLCTNCGYAALNDSFEVISEPQAKRIRENVINNFEADESALGYEDLYTLPQAIDRTKLALLSTIHKKAKLSEGSYICLILAWLIRDYIKEFELLDMSPAGRAEIRQLRHEADSYYNQAYRGFSGATKKETPPFCGFDAVSITYLLANMAYYFKDYKRTGILARGLMASRGATDMMKERCQTLLEDISDQTSL